MSPINVPPSGKLFKYWDGVRPFKSKVDGKGNGLFIPSSYCATRALIVFTLDPFNEYELFTIPLECNVEVFNVNGFTFGVNPSLMLKFDQSVVNFVKSPMIFYFIINIMFF